MLEVYGSREQTTQSYKDMNEIHSETYLAATLSLNIIT